MQPLGLADSPWTRIGIDLITGLPRAGKGKWDSILVITDHLTKMAHFVVTAEALDQKEAAELLI